MNGLICFKLYQRAQGQMTLNNINIKLKIDALDKEIKLLENKINEMSWQRNKYQQFFDKFVKEKNS